MLRGTIRETSLSFVRFEHGMQSFLALGFKYRFGFIQLQQIAPVRMISSGVQDKFWNERVAGDESVF